MPLIYGVTRSPPTRSAILTAKLIGLDFTLQTVDMQNQEHKSPKFLKISPAHTVPVFEDDDGFQVFDSHAIVAYMVSKYAKDDALYPKDLKKRALVDSMMHFDSSALWPSIVGCFVVPLFTGKPVEPEKEAAFKDRMASLNNILGERPYVAGDHMTVADICLIQSAMAPTCTGFGFGEFPNVAAWVDKMKKVQYFEEVVGRGTEELKAMFEAMSKK